MDHKKNPHNDGPVTTNVKEPHSGDEARQTNNEGESLTNTLDCINGPTSPKSPRPLRTA